MRLVSLLVMSSGTSACYTQRALTLDALPVGTRAEFTLTDRGAVELADSVGGTPVRITGRVQSANGERVVVGINRVHLRQGNAVRWGGESVGVPRAYVASVRERRFSWWRTALTGAAVTTGFLAVISKLGVNIGWLSGPLGDGGGGGPGTGQ
jgi:hypothetical protein